jgi:hypothetical protein
VSEPSTLTAEQRKALIEAVTEHYHGQGDAWDNILDPLDRKHTVVGFLAGVRWAQKDEPK